MNQEEALRALEIARRHESSGNTTAALRFARKALSLSDNSLLAAKSLIAKLEAAEASGTSTPQPSASTSSSNPTAGSTKPTPRAAAAKEKKEDDKPREYTKAQADLVKRVKACRVTDYYAILAIEKGCDDGAVKKAYRKLALGLHPDKCGAPGAEEAFKMVSKAFQVLSDSNKRAIFDQTGGDPDSRGGGGGGGGGYAASPFARGGGMGGGGSPFGDEMSPEDLFRFFFNGGGAGGPFGGGGGFQTYSFGPGGARFSTNMGGGGMGGRQRAAGGAGQGQQQGSTWLQLLPLLVLFGFSLLTQLPNLFSSSPPPDPDFAFSQSPRFPIERTTYNMHVPYFVNAQQFALHPIYKATLDANPSLGFHSSAEPGSSEYKQDLFRHILQPSAVDSVPPTEGGEVKPEGGKEKFVVPYPLKKFEMSVERSWTNRLQQFCQQELRDRNEKLERARGFFGFGADWDKVREITNAKLEHCERLSEMGYQINYN